MCEVVFARVVLGLVFVVCRCFDDIFLFTGLTFHSGGQAGAGEGEDGHRKSYLFECLCVRVL